MAMTPALAFTFMVLNPFKNFIRGCSIESLIHLVAAAWAADHIMPALVAAASEPQSTIPHSG